MIIQIILIVFFLCQAWEYTHAQTSTSISTDNKINKSEEKIKSTGKTQAPIGIISATGAFNTKDGFIGIDSYFYNLIDDSHWLPQATAKAIQKDPNHYWLLHIDCFATTAEEACLLRF